jgi:hypothetical protein
MLTGYQPNHDPFSLKTLQNSMMLDKLPGSDCFLRVKIGNKYSDAKKWLKKWIGLYNSSWQ